MPRKITLALLFGVSLLLFLLLLMPAAVLVERVPALRPGGAPLVLTNPQGVWWNGQANWQWQRRQGTVQWSLDWHGLVPGLTLKMRTTDDAARLSTWLGADWGDWQLQHARLSLPMALVTEHIPQGSASGRVDATLMLLSFGDSRIKQLQGTLQYSGGTVSWGRNGSALVPVLQGRLSMNNEQPTLQVEDPDNNSLLDARLANGRFELEVRRAWPMLLGVSQGGDPDDVVFQMSQPLVLFGGQ
ncbi:type II secretion system protein N [uncultured Alcanivorax sp.]|jgi:general secretion pathway protein N|uniref:type II secretion system protein N n=1 Tax=uncultured Alcanivorax sp. TaxID=191215 RepID=UPI002588EE8F|nr:type II secretion system protein N [uncultured Alcanivorax sp.]